MLLDNLLKAAGEALIGFDFLFQNFAGKDNMVLMGCLLYTSPSPRD